MCELTRIRVKYVWCWLCKPTVASTQVQNPNESPLYSDIRAIDDDYPEPPPSAPPIPPEESAPAQNLFSFEAQQPRQVAHEERYKEMISAAPPTTPPTVAGASGLNIKIPIYRDFSVPAPEGLTDGLTAPRVSNYTLHTHECFCFEDSDMNYVPSSVCQFLIGQEQFGHDCLGTGRYDGRSK